MKQILVVGSLAYDSISTPSGEAPRTLGGSANYFATIASLFSQVNLVGVVGRDYRDEDTALLKSRNVSLEGLQVKEGATFHWSGKYAGDLNEAITLQTELNVFADFQPVLPPSYKNSEFVFLANIHPALQSQVLSQVHNPQLIGLDTMNYWIQSALPDLKKVLKEVSVFLVNEGEAKALTKEPNAILAAPKLTEMGPEIVVVKRGEYGFVLYSKAEGYFILPAFPVGQVVDPTGAGDTFAGAFFGTLSQEPNPNSWEALKKACVFGVLAASFTIEGFGLSRLKQVTKADLSERLSSYKKVIAHPFS